MERIYRAALGVVFLPLSLYRAMFWDSPSERRGTGFAVLVNLVIATVCVCLWAFVRAGEVGVLAIVLLAVTLFYRYFLNRLHPKSLRKMPRRRRRHGGQ